MEVLAVVLLICCMFCLSIWGLDKDKKARDRQYNKFLKDIADLFYSAMNQKKEED